VGFTEITRGLRPLIRKEKEMALSQDSPKLTPDQLATREALFNLITGTMTNKTYVAPFMDAMEEYIDNRINEGIHDHCVSHHYPFTGGA
jgi:hypothetical protein